MGQKGQAGVHHCTGYVYERNKVNVLAKIKETLPAEIYNSDIKRQKARDITMVKSNKYHISGSLSQ